MQTDLKVVYPGTFDPITMGHEDIVRRAASLFSEVIVAVASNPGKKPFFELNERVEMASRVLKDCANVKVIGFSGLLMQFVQDQGARVVAFLRFRRVGITLRSPDIETLK